MPRVSWLMHAVRQQRRERGKEDGVGQDQRAHIEEQGLQVRCCWLANVARSPAVELADVDATDKRVPCSGGEGENLSLRVLAVTNPEHVTSRGRDLNAVTFDKRRTLHPYTMDHSQAACHPGRVLWAAEVGFQAAEVDQFPVLLRVLPGPGSRQYG